MKLRSICVSALLLVLWLFPLGAVAQPPAPREGSTATPQEGVGATQEDGATAQASQEQEAEAEPLQPIAEGEIPSRAELVEADLRRIEALIQPAPEVARIESALRSREAEIVRLRAVLDTVDPNRISTRRLGDLRLPWLQLEGELAAWATAARQRFDTLGAERERLWDVRAVWELTAREADARDMAPEMREAVGGVLTQVLDVEARVRERHNAVGAVAGRITSRQELVTDSLQQIADLAVIVRGRLFSRDAPPLWASAGAFEVIPVVGEALESGRDWSQILVRYVGLRSGRIFFVFVWFIVLLLGFLELKRRTRGGTSDVEGLEEFYGLIARPFSLALAFSLATAVLILPYPPGSAIDLLTVLAVVPIARLGSTVLPSIARRALYGIAVLMVLGRVAAIGPDASPATRLLLLVVVGLGFLGTGLAAMHGRKQARERGGWTRVVTAAASAATAVLGVAVAANILGWVQLSKMLTSATISTLFAAFGWAILVAAVAALLPPLIGGRPGQALPSLRRNQNDVERICINIAGIVATAAWLTNSLARFQIREPLREFGARISASELSVGGWSISAGGFFGAALVLLGTWLIARLVRFVLQEEVVPRVHLRRGAGQSLVTLANYTVYGVGIMMAASAMGLTGTQFAVVIGALSLGIGFGLQNIVNNFVSGLILIFERPIKVGDTVQTVDHWGKVQHIGIRASTIRSFDGAEIIVPNGDLIAKEVINWTRTDEIRRAEVQVGVAYGTDPETVLEILLRVAQEHPKAKAHPEPKAQMICFGDSSLDFRLRCWTSIDDWIDLVSDLHVAINRELKAAGIMIPFPQRDLHIIPPPAAKDPDMPSPLEATDAEDQPE